LSSATVDENGLIFAGLTEVTDEATSTETMKFTVTDATMHGLDLATDCTSSLTVRSTVTPPDTTVAGASTLYPTSLSFLLSGAPQSFTTATPPIVGYSLPSDTLTSVEMVGARADVATMALHSFSQQAAAC
jgi:hypothetical protein